MKSKYTLALALAICAASAQDINVTALTPTESQEVKQAYQAWQDHEKWAAQARDHYMAVRDKIIKQHGYKPTDNHALQFDTDFRMLIKRLDGGLWMNGTSNFSGNVLASCWEGSSPNPVTSYIAGSKKSK